MQILKILIIIFIFLTQKSFALENKIILKINNETITTIDLLNEIDRLKFFESNLTGLRKEEIYEIATQTLINHKIKKIEVSRRFQKLQLNNEQYLNSIIDKQIKNLNLRSLEDFKKKLFDNNINFENYKERLIIDILWNEIIFTLYSNKINIDEEFLKNEIIKKGDETNSFFLREIVFDANDKDAIVELYEKIKNDIVSIGFKASALKYSISDSAEKGGDIGWVNENLFNENTLQQIKKLKKFDYTAPIRTQSGFVIIQLVDTKKIKQEQNIDDQLKKLINIEKNQQLKNYSNLYFNKIKKDIQIVSP